MKHPMTYIRQSLSTRLSLWIVLFATVIFLAALGYLFYESRRTVYEEAMNRATQVLDNTVQRVTNILNRVEVAADNTEWLIKRHLDAPDSMFVYSHNLLVNNPDLNGCSIAFEPYFYKDRGKYFSAYSYNDGKTIETTQEGNDHYEYFVMDWYQLAKLLDRPVWTEPFIDYNPEEIFSSEMIASYCKPIKNKNGQYLGTLSVDLSLSWLSNTISAVKPYPNSYSILIGVSGTYFVHPDTTKLFYQTIFTETLAQEDTARTALGYAMLNGEEGMKQLKVNGEDCYVFYKPLGTTGWSVAIVCPESDIFSGYNRLQRAVLGIVILGLLLMLLFFSRIISRELKPLSKLAKQAETIASGQFDQVLPDDGRTDEIGQLSQSFGNMQHSLVSYIEELKDTTASKAAIENELKVASDIQMGMVPRIFPPFPNRHDIDLFASMSPAKEVGGDLYDFFVQDERLYFCVGDVSGKGIPASLFMAVTRNLFRIIAQQGHTPEEIATQINLFLSKDNDRGMFVTMFIGMADLKTGRLDFCNCGHNPPVLADGKEPAKFLPLQYDNQPLGLWEDDPFYGESVDDIRDKQLLVYTDGLNEAENPQRKLFGNAAILRLMSTTSGKDSTETITMLQEAVEQHRNGASPNDDLTLLCLKVKKGE
jgi:sigma-B regulation protein RsbU (phosphoserine phosphatase)